MDIALIVLQVLSVLLSFVFAFVVYSVLRLLLVMFRDSADDDDRKRFRILRMSDRAVGVICVLCFLAMVL